MINIIKIYFGIYFTEIIVGILIFSIAVVLVSIFYVIYSSTDKVVIKKHIKTKKMKKIKYTKQFIKGVDGIDLDLKVNKKNF